MSGMDARSAARLRAMAGLMKSRDLAELRAAAAACGKIRERLQALGRELAQARSDCCPATASPDGQGPLSPSGIADGDFATVDARTGPQTDAQAGAAADVLNAAHAADKLAARAALRRAELNVTLAAAMARWHDARSCAARSLGRESAVDELAEAARTERRDRVLRRDAQV